MPDLGSHESKQLSLVRSFWTAGVNPWRSVIAKRKVAPTPHARRVTIQARLGPSMTSPAALRTCASWIFVVAVALPTAVVAAPLGAGPRVSV